MTTQILLGNGYGLALATDSAVTVGGRRTYETSEKMILLGEGHPVAVLVSGAVTQFSLPVQVLVSEWAKTLRGGQLRKVVDYRENFMSWLRDNVHEFPEPETRLIDSYWNADNYLRGCWRDTSGSDEYTTIEEKTQATIEYLQYWIGEHESYRKVDRFADMGGTSHVERIIGELWSAKSGSWVGLGERVDYWFDDVEPDRLPEVKALIRRLIVLRCSTWALFESITTVIFAGFGAKEMVPATAQVQLFGSYQDWVCSSSMDPQIAEKVGSGFWLLKTIGQDDYIMNILLGYRSELIESAAGALADSGVVSAANHGSGEDPSVNSANVKEEETPFVVSERLWSAVEQGAEEKLLKPLRHAIAAMPLKSLADAARSLVGVQALGKAISAELQTTGGRIEVAIISRAEGVKILAE